MISKQINEEKFFKKIPFFKKLIPNPFPNIRQGLANLKHWLPVIWHDREYDYFFFEKIMAHKLKLMKDFYASEYPCATDAPEVAQQIDEVLTLYNRLEKDNYVEEIDPDLHVSLGLNKETGKAIFDGHGKSSEYRMSVYRQAEQNKERDRYKLYNLIAQNVENWWD